MTFPVFSAQSATGYNLTRSLRLRQSASAYLGRTPSVAGSRRIWTWSSWVKRGTLGSTFQCLFGASNGSTVQFYFGFAGDSLTALNWAGSTQMNFGTSAVYRDSSAWYHVVLAIDTTQATDTNRVKFYVNGVQVTSFSTASYPAQNLDIAVNALVPHAIGREEYSDNQWFDGYLAETYFIDGQQLTPSSFGQTSSTTGVWQPKAYTGTYGTNGFYLPYTDNSSLTTSSNVGLGKDFSGNGNYWATNNISITSGVTYDSMTDVPTLTNATTSNYCVMNSLARYSANFAYSNANLTASDSSSSNVTGVATFSTGKTGKYYFECTMTSVATNTTGSGSNFVGVATQAQVGGTVINTGSYRSGNVIYNLAGVAQTAGATYTTGDVIGVAVDVTNGTVQFYKNNVAQGATPSFTFTAGTELFPFVSTDNVAGTKTYNLNFGQRPFAYTPPTGFVALNTFNLPTPTIGATPSTQANKYFNVLTYAGSASNQTISGLDFQPDFIWFKERTTSGIDHNLFDSQRSNYGSRLISNGTNAEAASSAIISVSSTGYSLLGGVSTTNDSSGRTYVTWNWKANGTGVTNTAGSITSTVSANTSAGFSIVTFTNQTSGTATVGHGLGVAPKMVIVKGRNWVSGWNIYNSNLINANYYIRLDTTSDQINAPTFWNGTAPTSSVFTLGTAWAGSGLNTVAYCFSEVDGYSKIGSFTGNASADGPFIYTGFRPKFVMFKNITDNTTAWIILDTTRSTFNIMGERLDPNSSDAGSTFNTVDYLSNGFKMRANNGLNQSGNTIIYMAFAENPFKYSLAR